MTLSIIIPSYNTKKLLKDCLKSVFNETKSSKGRSSSGRKIKLQVIVVDNASKDGSVEMVKKNFSKVELIQNKENLGYAKANNKGIRKAKGKYILFLNSDTVILDRAIEKCLKFMKKKKDVDILGCQLLNKDRSIQPSGGFFPNLRQVFYWMFFIDELPFLNKIIKPYQQSRKEFYQKSQELDWVTGAFWLVKKLVIEKVGGFNEKYFMYSEEVEFSYLARRKGFKTFFYSGAKIIHLKGGDSTAGFERGILGEHEGLKRFYKKYKSAWEMRILRVFLKLGSVLRIFIFGILMGDKKKKGVYEKAFNMA